MAPAAVTSADTGINGNLVDGDSDCASVLSTATGTPLFGSPNCVDQPAWNEVTLGKVSSTWPFTSSKYNTHYEGHKVVRFRLADLQAGAPCIADDNDVAELKSCDRSDTQLWVVSGGWLVNVSATNAHSTLAQPQVLTDVVTARGGHNIGTVTGNASGVDTSDQQWSIVN